MGLRYASLSISGHLSFQMHTLVSHGCLAPSLDGLLPIPSCRVKAGQREAILALIERVEATNPLDAPTEHLEHCHGSWRLLFSTVTILVCSVQRSKLDRLHAAKTMHACAWTAQS